LSFLHERALKLLGKEPVNLFKPDPSLFANSDEVVQSRSTTNSFGEENKENEKNIFDKEQYLKYSNDETMSKFKMFDLIDFLFKPDGMVQTVKSLYEKRKMNEIPKEMGKILEKIKFFYFLFDCIKFHLGIVISIL